METSRSNHQETTDTRPWILYPAIDIHHGRVVRLTQGRFDASKQYARDPVAVARQWHEQGAQWLHIVDLDAARTGERRNRRVVESIRARIPVRIQYGGGVRTLDDVQELMEAGIERVVIGTAAFEQPEVLEKALDRHGERIAVGLDVRDDTVAVRGWEADAPLSLDEALDVLRRRGVPRLIVTSIRSDGMLCGPDLSLYTRCLKKASVPVIASGGVSSIGDLQTLASLRPQGLEGVIIGRALYEGTIELKECLAQWS